MDSQSRLLPENAGTATELPDARMCVSGTRGKAGNSRLVGAVAAEVWALRYIVGVRGARGCGMGSRGVRSHDVTVGIGMGCHTNGDLFIMEGSTSLLCCCLDLSPVCLTYCRRRRSTSVLSHFQPACSQKENHPLTLLPKLICTMSTPDLRHPTMLSLDFLSFLCLCISTCVGALN
jgi:hypothetical protein